VIYNITMRDTRGIQWDRWKIKVLRRRVGPREKYLKNDRYHDYKGEKRNQMG
jgi:hypothetical protein